MVGSSPGTFQFYPVARSASRGGSLLTLTNSITVHLFFDLTLMSDFLPFTIGVKISGLKFPGLYEWA